MAMKIEVAFRQGDVLRKHGLPGGMCFRLSFKWAACKMRGADFTFSEISASTAHGKHSDYRVESKIFEAAHPNMASNQIFGTYVSSDVMNAWTFLNRWGMKFTGRVGGEKIVYNGCVGVSGISVKPIDIFMKGNKKSSISNMSFIYGVYGREKNLSKPGEKTPAGHAMAFSNGRFFDPNFGEVSFSSDKGGDIGNDILSHIRRYYPWFSNQYVFLLENRNGTAVKKA